MQRSDLSSHGQCCSEYSRVCSWGGAIPSDAPTGLVHLVELIAYRVRVRVGPSDAHAAAVGNGPPPPARSASAPPCTTICESSSLTLSTTISPAPSPASPSTHPSPAPPPAPPPRTPRPFWHLSLVSISCSCSRCSLSITAERGMNAGSLEGRMQAHWQHHGSGGALMAAGEKACRACETGPMFSMRGASMARLWCSLHARARHSEAVP